MSHTLASETELFHGVFQLDRTGGEPKVRRHANAPAVIPEPQSGRLLRIATVDAGARAICPACSAPGAGGFVSFVQDLRLVYACPKCQAMVWLPGA